MNTFNIWPFILVFLIGIVTGLVCCTATVSESPHEKAIKDIDKVLQQSIHNHGFLCGRVGKSYKECNDDFLNIVSDKEG